MRRFLLKVLLLAALAAGLAAALALLAYGGPAPKRFGPEVYRAIRVCTSATPTARTLVLGDSVANQIFATGAPPPPTVAVATCNQAVTPLGNRLLLDRWLAANPQAEQVVYAALPGSWANDGTPEFTFHYFLFPFAETGLLDDAPADVRAHLRSRFGRLPMENASLRHLLGRNDRLYEIYETRFVRRPAPRPDEPIPPIALEQLRAMRDACAARGVRFRLAPMPACETTAPSPDWLERTAAQLRAVFPEADAWLATMRREPAEDFRDGVHFTPERLERVREPLRAEILAEPHP